MKTKTRIARLVTTEPGKFVDISVSYHVGGTNMLAGTIDPRGYWLDAQPVDVRDGIVTFTAFTGTRCFLEEAKRFSAKHLGELAARGKDLPKYQEVLGHVLAKNHLVLTEPAAA